MRHPRSGGRRLGGWASAFSLLALSACGDAPEEQATEAVRLALRDPDSAVFTEIAVLDDGRVCGNVNSRNGFGGMSGPEPFLVSADGAVSFLPAELEDFAYDMQELVELQARDVDDLSDYELERTIELYDELEERRPGLEAALAPFRDCANFVAAVSG